MDPASAVGSRPPGDSRPKAEARHRLEVLQGSRHFVKWKLILVGVATMGLGVFASYLLLNETVRHAYAAVITAISCLTIMLAPQTGLFLYYLLAFGRPQDVFWGLGELRLSLSVASVTLLAWVVYTGFRRNGVYFRQCRQLYAYLGMAVVVSLSSLATEGDWDRVIEYVKLFAMAIAFISFVDQRKWVRQAIGVLIVAVVFLTLWGAQQRFIYQVWRLAGPGINGTLSDRNAYSMFLAMGVPFIYLAATRFRWSIVRMFFWLMLPLAAYMIMMTSSRGGLLGLAAATMAVAAQTKYRAPMIALGIVGFLAFYLVAAPPEMRMRVGTISDYEEDESASGRIDAWRTGFKMVVANPLLGVGPGNFVREYPKYDPSHPRVAHNSFVQCAAEFGLVGLSLYLILIITTVRDLLRIVRRTRGDPEINAWARTIMASLVAYLVCASFLSMEDFELFYFLTVLTVSIRVVMFTEAKQSADHEEYSAAVETAPGTRL